MISTQALTNAITNIVTKSVTEALAQKGFSGPEIAEAVDRATNMVSRVSCDAAVYAALLASQDDKEKA